MRLKYFTGSAIVSACFVLLLALQANAQEFNYKVQLDRTIGHRDGELVISVWSRVFRPVPLIRADAKVSGQ